MDLEDAIFLAGTGMVGVGGWLLSPGVGLMCAGALLISWIGVSRMIGRRR